MSTSKLNIEDQLANLLEAGATEEEVLNTFRTLKHKKAADEAKKKVLENKRKEVIAAVLDYVTYATDQKPTKEEEDIIKKYMNDVLSSAEDVVEQKKNPELKVTKRGWHNGKKMTDAEIDEVFNKFWKGFI